MAIPFAYNPNTGTTISGVTNYGTLAVATGNVDWKNSGLQWYMGPDDSTGYVIGNTINSGGWRPQFWRSLGLNDAAFIALINNVSGNNYTSASSANAWVVANNFYTTFIYIVKTIMINSTSYSSISLNENGEVWTWGSNNSGQLGDNSTLNKLTPVSILGNKKTFCQIAGGGGHSLGIDKTGQVWTWGSNNSGQLGINSTICKSTPVSILGNKKTFCQIYGGQYHSLGIDKTGQVWSWGYNNYGQLGINSAINKCTPVSILGIRKTFCQITGGGYHSLGIDKNGQVWGWGYNNRGQLGDNSTVSKLTPVSILGNKKTFCQISGGNNHSLGIDKNGQVWGWGYNFRGQLGDNSTVSKLTPVSILGNKKTFCKIATGLSYSIALDKKGQVWGWGYNRYGQLGDNSTVSKLTPVSILGNKKTFCQIYGGYGHTIGIDKNGQVWSWGSNSQGQLGINSTICKSTPVSILGSKKTFCQISTGYNHSLGLDYNGQIWGWGYNNLIFTPVTISGTKKTFCQISATQFYSIAIDFTGQVWGWGGNGYGQLGDNSTTSRSTPVSILGNKKTFCKISTGFYHTAGIDNTGQVWSWGWNYFGALGDNYSTSRISTPISILGAKKTFCQISSGYQNTIGLDKNGQAWGWGWNYYGNLGDNSRTQRNTPVSILGNKKTFCQIVIGGATSPFVSAYSMALDKNGQVWTWGYNGMGQLGDNSTTSRSTPVSILGNKKTFCKISAGAGHSLGIDYSGQLWGWGYNWYGQLGDNSRTQRNTPVSILGNKKTFCQITTKYNHSLGIDKNGQVWVWGDNYWGQLTGGINTTTPIRVCNL